MSLDLITAPALEPVSLAEAKLHLKVDHSDEDTLISALIVAARRMAEHQTQRALVTQTWELVLDAFPADEIQLPKPKVLSIVWVKYLDTSGVLRTLDPAAYALDAATLPGYVIPVDLWPSPYSGANTVRVRFTAGYGPAAADVPADVVAWMLLQVGALYRNREAFAAGYSVAELPNRFVSGLLDAERVYL